VPVAICRLSGLRATARCPSAPEWFAPGTEPAQACDWHREGGTSLPAEFEEWAEQSVGGVAAAEVGVPVTVHVPGPPRAGKGSGFRILSPRDGDVYRIPAGVDPRYATVALRAGGGAAQVRWFVDGRRYRDARWAVAAGIHRIRALDASGATAEVTVAVE
jgi:membrane carboxypeptidase/penicillin-binding protein PbpC